MVGIEQRRKPDVKTVLIVEDDADIAAFLTQTISEESPYKPLLATNGLAALNAAKALKPNLFILDYRLVGSMNGIQLYDQLQAIKELQGIPAIMMSANLPVREIKKRQLVGIRKPFDLNELLQAIDQALS